MRHGEWDQVGSWWVDGEKEMRVEKLEEVEEVEMMLGRELGGR